MVFFDRTEEEIISNALDRLSSNTNITQLSPGSKARFIIDTVSSEQAVQHQIFDTNLMQAFVKYADGRFLDFFGDMMNLPRIEPTHASATDNNFMFYVSSGTFGSINGGSSFSIPAGTIVSTIPYSGSVVTPGIQQQPTVEYRTISAVTCPSDEAFVYASIRGYIEGAYSDVPRNVLNQHNFTSYGDVINNTLKCTNRYAISNGVDREQDENYRYRLANIFRARNLATLMSIRISALSTPGVSDIKEVSCEQGPGTFSIYVRGLTPTPGNALLQAVTTSVANVAPYGVRPFILAPNTLGLEFLAYVSWHRKAKAEDITRGYQAMRDAVERALNNLNIGESIVLDTIIDTMLEAAPLALSIGGNKINTFDEVWVTRGDSVGGTVRSSISGTEIVPLYNERIILETSNRYRGLQFITR
jgi:uncharacterized phage protein gp47/JayE